MRMKTLMFDLEHGSQTLGSKEYIHKQFGFPVLQPGTWDQFQSTIGKLYKQETVTEKVKVGNLEIDEERTIVVPRNGTKVDALILDTFSELSKKYMRQLSDKDGKMKLQGWGQLKNKLDGALDFLSKIPGVVICNCHSKVQTMDDGNKVVPYIDGSSKEDISKWFDFVLYTKTNVSNDQRSYTWITSRSEKYDHAKDRTSLLDPEMTQDYNVIINAAKEKGFDGAKILVIGSPGSGKTYSLQTLVNGGSK
tara:strand:- start:1983 stop:2732 length:750 start_codon:yes stop_codon:yes gene_type:complete